MSLKKGRKETGNENRKEKGTKRRTTSKLGSQGMKEAEHRIFREVKLLCMILLWWIHLINLSKPIEFTTSIVNHNGHHGLWVTVMCGDRFVSFNKCTTLVGEGESGEG